MSLQQFDERNPVVGHANMTSTYTPSTHLTLISATDVPVRIDQIVGLNRSTGGLNVDFYTSIGGTPYFLGGTTIPAYAGQTGVSLADLLSVLTTSDQKFLIIPPGQTLEVLLQSAPSGSGVVDIYARGGTL